MSAYMDRINAARIKLDRAIKDMTEAKLAEKAAKAAAKRFEKAARKADAELRDAIYFKETA
jgi:hypothetical protein